MKTTLTTWREELGYNVEELASEFDIQPDQLRLWESDFGSCSVQRLVELALEGLEAKKALDSVIVDDDCLERANAYLAEAKERSIAEDDNKE